VLYPIENIGARVIDRLVDHGRWGVFMLRGLTSIFTPPYRWNHLLTEVKVIGFDSISLITFTAIFTGMVLGLQGYTTLKQFGAEGALGLGVAFTLFTELGPVLSALLLIGRAGSSMSAELGVMRISDQISALESMGIDSYNYLVGPKMLASLICFPILSFLFAIVGVGGAYMAGVMILGVNEGSFYSGVVRAMANEHIIPMCLYKSIIFGFVMSAVCAYKGFFVGHYGAKGAVGVSKATTEAVVYASVTVLLWDYLVTSLLI
jgi:phospholipid/cholesterol/gamma-HCH transport system permease protein